MLACATTTGAGAGATGAIATLLGALASPIAGLALGSLFEHAPSAMAAEATRASWKPRRREWVVLFMGIFFTKYAVGVSIGMQPALVHNMNFALAVSVSYGAFSGIFLARATVLWRLALGSATPQSSPGKATAA